MHKLQWVPHCFIKKTAYYLWKGSGSTKNQRKTLLKPMIVCLSAAFAPSFLLCLNQLNSAFPAFYYSAPNRFCSIQPTTMGPISCSQDAPSQSKASTSKLLACSLQGQLLWWSPSACKGCQFGSIHQKSPYCSRNHCPPEPMKMNPTVDFEWTCTLGGTGQNFQSPPFSPHLRNKSRTLTMKTSLKFKDPQKDICHLGGGVWQ